jgi:hypothetical protein
MSDLKLSMEKWNLARDFIKTHARPLEKALYAFYFEEGSKEAVYQALETYQNSDGGFGHGIEPDFLLPDSSPMATSVGHQILRDLKTPETHPMVQASMHYLLKNLDMNNLIWQNRPKSVNDYHHTPWWHVEENMKELGYIKQNAFNPTAELVGYFWEYQTFMPKELLMTITNTTLKRLAESDYEMHDMLCVQRLAERLPKNLQEQVIPILKAYLSKHLLTSNEEWHGYGVTPLTFIESKDSLAASYIEKSLIESNLDFLIENQIEGIWYPTWPEEVYEAEHLAIAKPAWQGILTLKNLRIMKQFNRI